MVFCNQMNESLLPTEPPLLRLLLVWGWGGRGDAEILNRGLSWNCLPIIPITSCQLPLIQGSPCWLPISYCGDLGALFLLLGPLLGQKGHERPCLELSYEILPMWGDR